MVEKTFTEYLKNGKKNGVISTGDTKLRKISMNFQINEWTFTVFLVVLSLAIVAGKLYINYGSGMQHVSNMVKNGQALSAFPSMYNIFGDSQKLSNFDKQHSKASSKRLMNVSQEHADTMASGYVGITHKYSWLLRALLSGLGIVAFSWFIIYKDSDIPGVNPPIPFSPRKKSFFHRRTWTDK
ncbi:uncharacterized protein [Venturia canescens]|uniref:uncharacterized protein isoform X2 n=1 Tax=Venturia canescens TaxID=32260 RepID=UPI001C9D0BC3|nr:uncharacterized protein LOC122408976 isoform X2 [Venturia canescens]